MTAYAKTWDTDASSYRTATARALNKIETNLALMITASRNCPWNSKANTLSRALGTTYTNSSGGQRMVGMYVTQTATAGAGSATAKVLAQFNDAAESSLAQTACNPAVVGPITAKTRTNCIFFMVDNGGSYKLTDQGTSSGVGASQSSTILNWYEFDFFGVHTAQSWATSEVVAALTKPNNYATDAVAVVDKDAALLEQTDGNASGAPAVTADELCFVMMKSSIANNLGVKDSGGTSFAIGNSGAEDNAERTICGFVNNGGAHIINTAATTSQRGHINMPRVTSTVTDSSGLGNHGILEGVPVPSFIAAPTAGFGQAMQTNGTDSATARFVQGAKFPAASSASLPTTSFRHRIRFRYDGTTGGSGAAQVVCGFSDGATAGAEFGGLVYITAAGKVALEAVNGTPAFVTATGTSTMTNGSTYEVEANWDGSNLRIIVSVNGAAATVEGTTAMTTQVARVAQVLTVGKRNGPSNGLPAKITIEDYELGKTALHTAGYTPTGVPFVADSNTLVLAHFDVARIFTAAESGQATSDNWQKLDDTASQGFNATAAWSRQKNTGFSTDPGRIAFISLRISFAPTTTAVASYSLSMLGLQPGGQEQNTLTGNGIATESSVFCIMSPGQIMATNSSSNITITDYWIWTVPA